MNRALKIRIVGFVAGIAVVASLTGLAAHVTWRTLSSASSQFTEDQIDSFSSAQDFQKQLLALGNALFRYQFFKLPEDKSRFWSAYTNLDKWIDEQKTIVTSLTIPNPTALGILENIDRSYTNYQFAADNLITKIDSPGSGNSTYYANEIQAVERQSENLMELSEKLVKAHEKARTQFLADATSSLDLFRNLMLISLVILVLLVGWLAMGVYHGLITPLKVKLVQSQQLVERHEKLASLGMLAAGVAHEIRNPLTAIKAWLFMHQKKLTPGTPDAADAEIISKEIDRLERIVRDFLQFARPSEPNRMTISADQPLRDVHRFMMPQLEKANIRLVLADALDTSPLRIDPEQIKQVLINLIQNAAEAIGENGTITLRAVPQTKFLNNRATDVIVLEVADSGKGIPPEVEKRLFDPFFTTKDTGTGLGLSIAARILEKHGGALQYQTQVNRGTTFGVVLPRA